MAAKIKLIRFGTKKKPVFRIVIADESNPGSNAVEIIGLYSPRATTEKVKIDHDKVAAWLQKGAEPTDAVRKLLGQAGAMPPVNFEGKAKRKPKKEQAAPEEAKPQEVKPQEAAK